MRRTIRRSPHHRGSMMVPYDFLLYGSVYGPSAGRQETSDGRNTGDTHASVPASVEPATEEAAQTEEVPLMMNAEDFADEDVPNAHLTTATAASIQGNDDASDDPAAEGSRMELMAVTFTDAPAGQWTGQSATDGTHGHEGVAQGPAAQGSAGQDGGTYDMATYGTTTHVTGTHNTAAHNVAAPNTENPSSTAQNTANHYMAGYNTAAHNAASHNIATRSAAVENVYVTSPATAQPFHGDPQPYSSRVAEWVSAMIDEAEGRTHMPATPYQRVVAATNGGRTASPVPLNGMANTSNQCFPASSADVMHAAHTRNQSRVPSKAHVRYVGRHIFGRHHSVAVEDDNGDTGTPFPNIVPSMTATKRLSIFAPGTGHFARTYLNTEPGAWETAIAAGMKPDMMATPNPEAMNISENAVATVPPGLALLDNASDVSAGTTELAIGSPPTVFPAGWHELPAREWAPPPHTAPRLAAASQRYSAVSAGASDDLVMGSAPALGPPATFYLVPDAHIFALANYHELEAERNMLASLVHGHVVAREQWRAREIELRVSRKRQRAEMEAQVNDLRAETGRLQSQFTAARRQVETLEAMWKRQVAYDLLVCGEVAGGNRTEQVRGWFGEDWARNIGEFYGLDPETGRPIGGSGNGNADGGLETSMGLQQNQGDDADGAPAAKRRRPTYL